MNTFAADFDNVSISVKLHNHSILRVYHKKLVIYKFQRLKLKLLRNTLSNLIQNEDFK